MPRTTEQIQASQRNIKKTYPLPVYNYRVDINGVSISFTEVEGLNIEYETLTYKHGISCREGNMYTVGMIQPIEIKLSRGIINDDNKKILHDWQNTINLNTVSKENVAIHLCDEIGSPLITWTVIDAFPKSFIMPAFNVEGSEIAIESLELMASYIKIIFHN